MACLDSRGAFIRDTHLFPFLHTLHASSFLHPLNPFPSIYSHTHLSLHSPSLLKHTTTTPFSPTPPSLAHTNTVPFPTHHRPLPNNNNPFPTPPQQPLPNNTTTTLPTPPPQQQPLPNNTTTTPSQQHQQQPPPPPQTLLIIIIIIHTPAGLEIRIPRLGVRGQSTRIAVISSGPPVSPLVTAQGRLTVLWLTETMD
ncbi:hypothetical protein Pmani_030300 [Petrolisthes manimaculis]|uniref:Uncharacterized protein n=1 Tax=Petrolisthes manimaculis TaxID=1843537 RepID=A0AAE1TTL0_9EUCA|nr:hypothetical protein Pmani_030300 [Petrolisthes manimaculis]